MLAALVALLACVRANVHEGRGIVREVDREARQIVLEHDEIPGFMSAMTMSFDVADPALLERAEPGQHVEFEIEADGRGYRIVSLRAEGERAGAVRAPMIASARQPEELAPDFRLVDQSGKPLALADLRGKLVLLDFVFTRCPGPCPILTGLHAELQRSLAPELRGRAHFVSISLDPAHDTPAALEAYARARGADLANWSFLTGPVAEVEDVVRRYGVGTLRSADGTIEHLVVTFLIDGDGRIARRWIGLEHPVEDLAREIERLARAGS